MPLQRTAIVTGGTGFVATRLILRLLSGGWKVIPVSRLATGQTLSWDDFWQLELGGVTTLFHLAAVIPANMEDSSLAEECLRTNALLTLRLAEHIASHSKAQFIHCSTGQLYRYQTEPAAEDTPVETFRRACIYLSSKWLAEEYLRHVQSANGLAAAIVRMSSVYGPGMPARSLVYRLEQTALKQEPIILRHGGRECFDMVHVDDAVELLARAAEANAKGVFNCGSGRAITVRSIAETINECVGNRADIRCENDKSALLQAGFAPLCIAKATATFDWYPRAFAQGFTDYRESHASSRH